MRCPGTLQSTLARAIRTQHLELTRGLWTLPLIARMLPLLAMVQTVWMLVYAFRGGSGERTAFFRYLTNASADALLPLLAGFSAATIAQSGHIYFQARLQDMLREMQSTASDIQTWAQR